MIGTGSAQHRNEQAHPALRRWAESKLGGKVAPRKIIVGWEWDGRSPGCNFLLAPKGRVYRDCPGEVWREAQS
jgi:hypothetical protein